MAAAKQPTAPPKGGRGRGRGKGKSPRQQQAVVQEPVLERYEQAIRCVPASFASRRAPAPRRGARGPPP